MKTQQPFIEFQQHNIEAAMRLAESSLEHSQRIISLQLNLARQFFDMGTQNIKALANNDPADAMRLRIEYVQESARQMAEATQELAAIGNEAREDFTRVWGEELAMGSELANSLTSFWPFPGSDNPMAAAMKQAVDTANATFERITRNTSAAITNQPQSVVASVKAVPPEKEETPPEKEAARAPAPKSEPSKPSGRSKQQ